MEIDKLLNLVHEFELKVSRLNWDLLKRECPGIDMTTSVQRKIARIQKLGDGMFSDTVCRGIHRIGLHLVAETPGAQVVDIVVEL